MVGMTTQPSTTVAPSGKLRMPQAVPLPLGVR
jgi:hypothetical protein